MHHLNIEIKARCPNQENIRRILKEKKADFKGTDHQIDSYFKVNSGRLKIREGNIENYLIYYDRKDKEGPKQSNVILFDLDRKSSLKKILTKALGILVVVDKKREIYFIGNVKFHIDDVKDLGTFVEIECIAESDDEKKETLLEQCKNFMKLLGITKKDLISVSYSDLLLKR